LHLCRTPLKRLLNVCFNNGTSMLDDAVFALRHRESGQTMLNGFLFKEQPKQPAQDAPDDAAAAGLATTSVVRPEHGTQPDANTLVLHGMVGDCRLRIRDHQTVTTASRDAAIGKAPPSKRRKPNAPDPKQKNLSSFFL
jgi:hypothetical protein